MSRYYRHSKEETPSHPGGVSSAARDRVEKHHKERERGLKASTSDKHDGDRNRRRGMLVITFFGVIYVKISLWTVYVVFRYISLYISSINVLKF